MPGYSGLEVCEKVKNSVATARVPVLLTVTNMEPYSPADGNRVGADGVLIKPFEATDVLSVLHKFEEKLAAAAAPPSEPQPVEEVEPEPAVVSEPKASDLPQDIASAPALGIEHLEPEPPKAAEVAVQPAEALQTQSEPQLASEAAVVESTNELAVEEHPPEILEPAMTELISEEPKPAEVAQEPARES
jgi:hypothetical protein